MQLYLMVNLGKQLFSEPRTIGANEKAKDHTSTAAASGSVGQIVGYKTKKNRHTGYADFFHVPSIIPNRFFSAHGLADPAHFLQHARFRECQFDYRKLGEAK